MFANKNHQDLTGAHWQLSATGSHSQCERSSLVSSHAQVALAQTHHHSGASHSPAGYPISTGTLCMQGSYVPSRYRA